MTAFPAHAPPSPRPHCVSCRCQDPGPLAARLREAARQYASALADGDEIHGDPGGVDDEYIAPFARYLPEALIEAGFRIAVRLDGDGRLVTQVHRLTDASPQTKETST